MYLNLIVSRVASFHSWKKFLDRFNVIGKFETMKEDVEYIIKASNLNISFPKINSHGKDHKLLSLRYFRGIDAESIKKLYDVYKIDFEMFGYSIDQYLLQALWTLTLKIYLKFYEFYLSSLAFTYSIKWTCTCI